MFAGINNGNRPALTKTNSFDEVLSANSRDCQTPIRPNQFSPHSRQTCKQGFSIFRCLNGFNGSFFEYVYLYFNASFNRYASPSSVLICPNSFFINGWPCFFCFHIFKSDKKVKVLWQFFCYFSIVFRVFLKRGFWSVVKPKQAYFELAIEFCDGSPSLFFRLSVW